MFHVVTFILKHAWLLVLAIALVEQLYGDRTGQERKAAVLSALNELLDRFNLLPGNRDWLSPAIDLVVDLFHRVGLFRHKELS